MFSLLRAWFGSIFLIALLTGGTAFSSSAQVDYGAAKANASRSPADMIRGGRDRYDYLALHNHRGPSGVPLGGIGVGYFDLTPNGQFNRIAINNWHDVQGIIHHVPGTFLAVWRNGHAHLLELGKKPLFGMVPAKTTVYRGLYPVIHLKINRNTALKAWSGLIPHDVKDSSLPVAFIDVTVHNPKATAQAIGVAFSWQDVIGRKLRDLAGPALIREIGATSWSLGEMPGGQYGAMPYVKRVRTQAQTLIASRWRGVLQRSKAFVPLKATFQNYNNQIAIVARTLPGQTISTLPSYQVAQGSRAWSSFCTTGEFPADASAATKPVALYRGAAAASVVAVKMMVAAGASATAHFIVCWYAPPLRCGNKSNETRSFLSYDKNRYGRYFQNYFNSLPQILDYAAVNGHGILRQTQAWHKPILRSSYPEWLKFKLINSAYTMYTNTILNRQGDFAVMEGGMGGLTGTMDQRLINHEFYLKFFPHLNRRELSLFADNEGKRGEILHFDGNYYIGLDSPDGQTPVPGNWMLDNSGSWLYQLAEYYRETGDQAYIERYRKQIIGAVNFLHHQIQGKVHIPQGPNTYDDFWQPPINIYNAGTFPVFMRAAAALANAMADHALAVKWRQWGDQGTHDLIKYLWNGRYFSYGCNADGSKPVNNLMSGAQLAGEFLNRYLGFGDLVPFSMVRASLIAQMKTNLSHSPDYYAPKVWDIKARHAALDPGTKNNYSTCWPFQLEAFTAMPLIQAGYVDDGLDVMKHIQLVNLRNGWTWSQNLWNPAERAYVSAPATWLVTDVLASAALDLPHHTLHLAPLFLAQQTKVSLPLYYPRFWAVLSADRRNKMVRLSVNRVFTNGKRRMVISRIIADPVGKPTSDAVIFDIPPFMIRAGATLEFRASKSHSHFTQSGNKLTIWTRRMSDFFAQKLRKSVLPRATTVPFMRVATGTD